MSFMDVNCNLKEIGNELRGLTRKKNSEFAAKMAKEALADLDKIRISCDNLGLNLDLNLCLSMVYRPKEYDGLMFQLQCEIEKSKIKRHKSLKETIILVAGGRYDSLIESFRKPSIEGTPPTKVTAVGASIAFDRIVGMVLEKRKNQGIAADRHPVEVLVCSVGLKNLLREKLCLLKELWTNDISADYLQEPVNCLEDLQEFFRHLGVKNIVVFKEMESAQGMLLLKSCDKAGIFQDKKVARADVVNCILGWRYDMVAEAAKSAESSSPYFAGGGPIPVAKTTSAQDLSTKENRSESFAMTQSSAPYQSQNSGVAGLSNMKIQFLETIVDRNTRKRLIQSVETLLGQLLLKFHSKTRIEVIATEMPGPVIKTLQGGLEVSSEAAFKRSAGAVAAQWNKFKKPLGVLADVLGDILFDSGQSKIETSNNNSVIVICSYTDEVHRVILP